MSPTTIALKLLEFVISIAPVIVEVVTGVDRITLSERIARAHLAVRDPIDVSVSDAELLAELTRVVRGES